MLQVAMQTKVTTLLNNVDKSVRNRIQNKKASRLFDLPSFASVALEEELKSTHRNNDFKLPIRQKIASYLKVHDTYAVIAACEQMTNLLHSKTPLAKNVLAKLLSKVKVNGKSATGRYGLVNLEFLERVFAILYSLLLANRAVLNEKNVQELIYSGDNRIAEYWLSAEYIESITARKYGIVIRYGTAEKLNAQYEYQKTLLALGFLESIGVIERRYRKNRAVNHIDKDFNKLYIRLDYYQLFNLLVYIYNLIDHRKHNFENLKFLGKRLRNILLKAVLSIIPYTQQNKTTRQRKAARLRNLANQLAEIDDADKFIDEAKKILQETDIIDAIQAYRKKADKKNWSVIALGYMLDSVLSNDSKYLEAYRHFFAAVGRKLDAISKEKPLTLFQEIQDNQLEVKSILYTTYKPAFDLYNIAIQHKLPKIIKTKEAEKFADMISRLMRGGFGALVGKYISSADYRDLKEQMKRQGIKNLDTIVGRLPKSDPESAVEYDRLVEAIDRLAAWKSFGLKDYVLTRMIVNPAPESANQPISPLAFVLDDDYYTDRIAEKFLPKTNILPETLRMVAYRAGLNIPRLKHPSEAKSRQARRYAALVRALKDLARFFIFNCQYNHGFKTFWMRYCIGNENWQQGFHKFVADIIGYYESVISKGNPRVLNPSILKPESYVVENYMVNELTNTLFNKAPVARYIRNYLVWRDVVKKGNVLLYFPDGGISPVETENLCPPRIVDKLMKAPVDGVKIVPAVCLKKLSKFIEDGRIVPIRRELMHKP